MNTYWQSWLVEANHPKKGPWKGILFGCPSKVKEHLKATGWKLVGMKGARVA